MNIAILGVGLIGGSIGLAAHRAAGGGAREEDVREEPPEVEVRGRGAKPRMQPIHVRGFDPDPEAIESALRLRAIDEGCSEIPEAVSNADIVFAAGPVRTLPATVRAALAAAPSSCLVSDVGSAKRALMSQLEGPAAEGAFIGGHPLAGAELAGVEHARANLFDGALWCLTPACSTEADERRRRLVKMIAMLGAHPIELRAEEHDRLMAEISHLPHILASLLLHGLERSQIAERLAAAGPSFKDATRVAASSSAIWADIYAANADMLSTVIDGAIERLQEVKGMLRRGEADALYAWHELARERCEALRCAPEP